MKSLYRNLPRTLMFNNVKYLLHTMVSANFTSTWQNLDSSAWVPACGHMCGGFSRLLQLMWKGWTTAQAGDPGLWRETELSTRTDACTAVSFSGIQCNRSAASRSRGLGLPAGRAVPWTVSYNKPFLPPSGCFYQSIYHSNRKQRH